jgi:hypothetical protein
MCVQAEHILTGYKVDGVPKGGVDFTRKAFKSRYLVILKDMRDTFKENPEFLTNYGRKLSTRLRCGVRRSSVCLYSPVS